MDIRDLYQFLSYFQHVIHKNDEKKNYKFQHVFLSNTIHKFFIPKFWYFFNKI